MHERNISLAPKGKAKESVHWQLGWWDLTHSLEGTNRPVQWTKSSVIYMAHESEPRVIGRHFPSSRQFLLPTPPFISPMDSYEPPTVLAISPTEDWMFAYFPGKGCEGWGCSWRKEAELDHWTVVDSWSYPVGGGIVTAAWICPHREWVVSDAGSSSRLPALGPPSSLGSPLLVLVTESHYLHVFTMGQEKAVQLGGRVSLLEPTDPVHPFFEPEPVGKVGGDRICTKAAIGLCYQESTILVAMRSQLRPSQHSIQTFQAAVDLGLTMDLSQPNPIDSPFVAEWEAWGEEQMISLCEVRVESRLNIPPVMSRPLPPIYHQSPLIDMAFYCPYPHHSHPSPTKPESKNSASHVRSLYLAATFFDPDDYTSLPKSEIVLYNFVASSQSSTYWALRDKSQRPSQTKVPSFLRPSPSRGGFLVGYLDAGGLLPRRKSKFKEANTGAIEVLKVPGLTAHEDWESVPIHSHVQAGTVDVPVSVAVSPNDTLICCVSSPLLGSHQSIQGLPRRVSGDTSLALTGSLPGDLSKHLVCAIRSRYSPSDVIHALAAPSLPTQVTVDTLYNAFTTMEADSFGHMQMWTAELLGVATEVYCARTQRLERGPEQDLCAARWQTTYEISSLAACCGAFDTCREGDSYDLDAVWQLLGITGWVIELVEKLFKECIFVGEGTNAGRVIPDNPDGPKGTTLDSPIFLHLVHPYALSRLRTAVDHVKRFHDQVAKLSAKGENSHIAKDFLMDITEGSGVDLQLLGPLLADILHDGKALNKQDLQRSLASCSPVPALVPHIRKVVDKVSSSKAVDRARLFIKPADLSDGITRLALSEPAGTPAHGLRDKNVDVVKKNALWRNKPASVCVRCGGRSDVALERRGGAEGPLSRWQTWEKSWQMRCVCGGMWSSAMYS
ncbi:hypothetical protein C8Q80DRAFT_1103764 [Daedaleopsis nitida]|nr:hypothetical protein C8Q80DRAFT_1103764 [Daedaleopsis nitida]